MTFLKVQFSQKHEFVIRIEPMAVLKKLSKIPKRRKKNFEILYKSEKAYFKKRIHFRSSQINLCSSNPFRMLKKVSISHLKTP